MDPRNERIFRHDPFDGGLGFSLATRVGEMVYTSGMVGLDEQLNVPADPAEEFRRLFENLAGVLDAVGSSLAQVIESTNFFAVDTMDEVYPVFEEVRKEVFSGNLPASTSVGVARLLDPRFRVEVRLVALGRTT